MRVLIIDDDRAHGEALAELLNSRGLEAYFAPSLGEAEWLLELFRFRVAVLDHDMPGGTGVQVADELRRRDPELRTILMSACEANRASSTEAGETPFLAKPIRAEELVDLITQAGMETSVVVRIAFPLVARGASRPSRRSRRRRNGGAWS